MTAWVSFMALVLSTECLFVPQGSLLLAWLVVPAAHVAVCGKKWSKRALGMTAPLEQLQFVWRAAKFIALCAKPALEDPEEEAALSKSKSEELERLLALRATIVEALPETAIGHWAIREQELKQLAEEAAAFGAAGQAGGAAATSAISLASVGDALEVGAM